MAEDATALDSIVRAYIAQHPDINPEAIWHVILTDPEKWGPDDLRKMLDGVENSSAGAGAVVPPFSSARPLSRIRR
jgi:hypothetical protein